jgi:hypothetical protein
MECTTNAASGVASQPAPPAPTPIVVSPMSDRESMDGEALKLQELSSRVTAARSVY